MMKKTLSPAEDETPRQYKKEIQEPDTDELLEQYGKEFGEDETLESSHTPKPPSPIKHETKKPVTVPARHRSRGSSETVDDSLFLSPGKPAAAAKPRVNKTRIIGGCIVLTAIIAAVYFIGLPMLNPPAVEITPIPEPTIVGTHPSSPDSDTRPGLPCSRPPA